jgi:hypothetical protein
MPLPTNNKAIGDAGHVEDHNSIVDEINTIKNTYLPASASSNYLTISSSSNFLPVSSSSNFLPTSASFDYLRIDTASSTYLRQDTASASYLQISASSNYLPASASSSYGLKSGTLSQFAETTSSQLAGVISDETGSGSLVFGTSPTLSTPIMLSPEERCNIVSTAASGTINFNILTSTIWFYTNNATADHTLNFRGDAGNTLNSLLAIGDSISLIWLNTNGSSAFRPTAFQIDGASITPIWSGGAAPTTGNANSIDAYSFSIIKTAATPTYTVLAGQARFA